MRNIFAKRKTYVYIIFNDINDKLYIGETFNIKKRFYEHKTFKLSSASLINRAILKHGKDNFHIEVIKECESKYEALKAEEFLIDYFDTSNMDLGYNLLKSQFLAGFSVNKLEGEKSKTSKLTDNIVIDIYNKYVNENYNTKDLEIMYSISDSTINGIIAGKSWKHLNLKPLSFSHIRKRRISIIDRNSNKYKLNEKQVVEIRKMSSGGMSNVDISKIFNVGDTAISNVVLRKTWKHVKS